MTTNVAAAATGLSPYAIDDLVASGLVPSDIAARLLTAIEFTATGPPTSVAPDGYVIPYFDISGDPVQFYRVKVLDTMGGPKYRSMKNQPNHIYYPPGWARLMKQPHPYVIITEGEKKAAAAVKSGFPCVALSGVDNWRNRHIRMPANTELKTLKKDGPIIAKIPSGDSNALVIQDSGVVAVGFHDLVDYVVQQEMEIIIIFDTDKGGLKTQVQRAAAALGYELRYRGLAIASIRQLILPPAKKGDKIGLDDYLMRKGTKEFASILRACRQKRIAFPRHPNPKTYVASRLQKARLSRKEVQDVALSILMELETRGRRLRNVATQNMFFFNEKTHTLLDVHLNSQRVMLHDTAFGAYLYREFNLSATDTRVVGWLAAQFHGEPGAEDARTQRVFAKPDDMKDCMAFQLSDSHYVIITPNPDKPYIICENGTHGVLFEQGHVSPIPHVAMELALEEAMESNDMLWEDVLGDFNFVPLNPSAGTGDLSEEQLLKEGRHLAILLYYISPWLLRWKGLQLPVELVIGEPGSGKAQPLTSRVLTPDGWCTMGDIQVGSEVITSTGIIAQVTHVHPQGSKDIYKITFTDGTEVECCDEHIWKVQSKNDQIHESRHKRGLGHTSGYSYSGNFWRYRTLREIREKPLRYGGQSSSKFHNYVPIISPTDFTTEDLPLAPYLLGALLGDGSFRTSQVSFTSEDKHIVDKVSALLPIGDDLRPSSPNGIGYGVRGKNITRTHVQSMGLWNKYSYEKSVPRAYLWGKAEDRLLMLQGLMDTDGTAITCGAAVFNTSSEQLGKDVQHLVQSLGGQASISLRTAPLKKGHRLAYNIQIRLPVGVCPFTLPKKVEYFEGCRHQRPLRAIKDITYVGKQQAQCITLEDPKGLYVTDGFIVTHNSSLYELRQTIVTGYPRLSNMTNDIKDWYAGITGRGGLYVMDNVHFTGSTKDYQQRLSDELCRLVTDPDPHIEQRKYYTNADIISLPVSVTFALTSIEQPFFTLDLIQRAAIFELHVIQTGHDANWVVHQMAKGDGRVGWVAHHLATIHKFLHAAVHQGKWDSKYRAKHRLAHYEQALMLMADTLGMPSDWIPAALQRQTATKMSEADWTMSGLAEFVVYFKRTHGEAYEGKRFDTRDIAEWAEAHDTFHKNGQLTNGWRLGKYLRSHRGTMQKTTGAFENGKQGNRIMYSVA